MFCKYCGKQIPDGQVCSCQAQQAPQQPQYQQAPPQQPQYQQAPPQYQQAPSQGVSIDMSGVMNDVKAWLKNITTNLSWLTVGIFGGASYLLYSIFYLCMLGSISASVGIAFLYSLLTIVISGVFSIGTLTLKDLIAKRNIDIQAHISRFFGISVLNGAILLVGGLGALISMHIGLFFIFAAVLVRIRDYVSILNGFFKEKNELVATLIVVGVIAFILTISNVILMAAIDEYFGFVFSLAL